jgi:pre-rRNA-processing protein IPI3
MRSWWRSSFKKVWSLSPPFDLLTTFQLPDGSLPTCLAVDTSERFFYAGTSTGTVHHFTLFRYREGSDRVTESIGGAGQGSASIKADLSVISHKYVTSALLLFGDLPYATKPLIWEFACV